MLNNPGCLAMTSLSQIIARNCEAVETLYSDIENQFENIEFALKDIIKQIKVNEEERKNDDPKYKDTFYMEILKTIAAEHLKVKETVTRIEELLAGMIKNGNQSYYKDEEEGDGVESSSEVEGSEDGTSKSDGKQETSV
jgi:hypothetical protein